MEDAVEFGQRVQKERNNPQMGLFDMGDNQGRSINVPPMPAVDEWDERQLLAFEKESLGFYVTGHPLRRYEALLDKYSNTDTATIMDADNGSRVRIGGMIQSIRTLRTRKGDLMAFVALEDLSGSVEIIVFPEAYAAAADLLVEESAVLVQGEVQRDEKAVKVIADTVIEIDRAEATWTASVRLNLDVARTDRAILLELSDVLKRHPGSCPAAITLKDAGRIETVISLPDTLRLAAGPSLRKAVRRLLGYSAVETVCMDIAHAAEPLGNGRWKKRNSRNGARNH